MKLTLDYTQRLNLHALMGGQRSDVGAIRAIWAVQDRIALDAEEARTIEMKSEFVNGQERTMWNSAISIPSKDFELSDAEVARIKAAVQTWSNYNVGADRRWLKPLVDMLFSAEAQSSPLQIPE